MSQSVVIQNYILSDGNILVSILTTEKLIVDTNDELGA